MPGFSILPVLSLHLDGRPEVYKKPVIDSYRSKITNKLDFVFFEKISNCLKFQYQSVFDDQVRVKVTDDLVAIVHGNGKLLLHFEPNLFRFNLQSVFIDLFLKSGTEFIVDPIRAPDYSFRKFVNFHLVNLVNPV